MNPDRFDLDEPTRTVLVSSDGGRLIASGGTLLNDAAAREDGWEHLIRWLATLPTH